VPAGFSAPAGPGNVALIDQVGFNASNLGNTYGHFSFWGDAFFFEGQSTPSGATVQPNHPAGQLPVTNGPPSYWSNCYGKKVWHRFFMIFWNFCNPKDQKISVHPDAKSEMMDPDSAWSGELVEEKDPRPKLDNEK